MSKKKTMFCKYCKEEIEHKAKNHDCKEKGLLNIKDDGDSFMVSALIGYTTDSGVLGGIIGGDFVGGIIGDLLND